MKNPYNEFLEDESSGCTVLNDKHELWQEGYDAFADYLFKNSTPASDWKEVASLRDKLLVTKVNGIRRELSAIQCATTLEEMSNRVLQLQKELGK